MNHRIEAVEAEVKDIREKNTRFERSYVEARRQFGDKLSEIATAVLSLGDSLRNLITTSAAVKQDVAGVKQEVVALRKELSDHREAQRLRWELDDENQGALLREFAKLHDRDAVLQGKQEKTDEEITKVHDLTKEQIAAAETDRARATVRTGVATALGGAVAGYLKANPDAFEHGWKAIVALLSS